MTCDVNLIQPMPSCDRLLHARFASALMAAGVTGLR